MKNILEICKSAADLAGVSPPTDLFDVNSQHDRIFFSIAQSALESLMRYGDWQELTKDAKFKTSGEKTIYLINNIVPDFYQLLNNTIFIKDSGEKIIGSITPEQWSREKMFNCSSIGVKFKIQNNCIKFLVPPPAGIEIVFQYRSSAVVIDPGKYDEEKSEITKNTDIPIFDEYLVKCGVLWRTLARNGMDYAEAFNEYQNELKKRFGSALATKDINLANGYIGGGLGGVIINATQTVK